MYYYVFEQPHTNVDRKVNDKVRMHLTGFGIAGEFCVSSPARSAEELVDMGLRKGVGTVGAGGSDYHINRVVNTLKGLERGLHRDIVLGVIPTDKESSLRERLRLQNIQEACEALKYRRFTTVDVGYIEGASYFLTTAEIHTSRPTVISIKADRWESEAKITDLTIFSDLTFSFFNSQKSKGLMDKWVTWLTNSRSVEDKSVSLFRARIIRVSGEAILPVTVEGTVVAKTPVVAYKMAKALKLIVKRDRFTPMDEDKNKESE